MRAALVRYAQPRPQSVSDLLDLVRRLESALGQHAAILQREGDALWDALEGGTSPGDEEHAEVVALLRVATELDQLGDVLAELGRRHHAASGPTRQVDAVVEEVGTRLDVLGVPHEERPPPRQRG